MYINIIPSCFGKKHKNLVLVNLLKVSILSYCNKHFEPPVFCTDAIKYLITLDYITKGKCKLYAIKFFIFYYILIYRSTL